MGKNLPVKKEGVDREELVKSLTRGLPASARAAVEEHRPVLDEIRDRVVELSRGGCQLYVDIGHAALAMRRSIVRAAGRSYGAHAVEQVAVYLGVGVSTVSHSIRVVETYSSEQMKKMIERQEPWRTVQAIASLKDPDSRKAVIEMIEQGKLRNSDGVRDAVDSQKVAEAEQKARRLEERAPRPNFRSFSLRSRGYLKSLVSTGSGFIEKIQPKFVEALGEFSKYRWDISPGTAETLASTITAAREILVKLSEIIDATKAEIDRAMKRSTTKGAPAANGKESA